MLQKINNYNIGKTSNFAEKRLELPHIMTYNAATIGDSTIAS